VFFNVCLDLLNIWLVLVIVLEKREIISSVCAVSQKIDYLNFQYISKLWMLFRRIFSIALVIVS
jgi:hypothetical protein